MARIIRTEINAKTAWHLTDPRSAPVDTVLQLYSGYKKVQQLRATARSQWHEFW
jgi:hypothetical protein